MEPQDQGDDRTRPGPPRDHLAALEPIDLHALGSVSPRRPFEYQARTATSVPISLVRAEARRMFWQRVTAEPGGQRVMWDWTRAARWPTWHLIQQQAATTEPWSLDQVELTSWLTA